MEPAQVRRRTFRNRGAVHEPGAYYYYYYYYLVGVCTFLRSGWGMSHPKALYGWGKSQAVKESRIRLGYEPYSGGGGKGF